MIAQNSLSRTAVVILTSLVAQIAFCQAEEFPPFHAGVCTHFGQNKGMSPQNLELMQQAGITSLRDELSWGSVEGERGRYGLSDQKSVIFRRAAQMGIAPMLILDYANRHYDGGDRPESPDALEGYARYAEFLVKHFGKSVPLYEVWNEYDIGIGMPEQFRQGGSPQDYVSMLKHVYPRIKRLAPEITVVGGSVTPGGVRRGWLEEAVKLGALQHCDMLSIHTYNYGAGPRERTPEAWVDWMLQVQQMLRSHNEDRKVPLLVTEMGWPTHAGKSNSTSPEISASYLGRLYLLARSLPFVRGVWWYDYQDDGWDEQYNEENFGVVRPDLTPKPSYYVMADVAPLAARGVFSGRVKTTDPDLWVLRFNRENETIWALWSADDQPRQVLLEADRPDGPLELHELGHPPLTRSWGHRPWAGRGRKQTQNAQQTSLVVGHRPWLVRGNLEGARVADVSKDLGNAAP